MASSIFHSSPSDNAPITAPSEHHTTPSEMAHRQYAGSGRVMSRNSEASSSRTPAVVADDTSLPTTFPSLSAPDPSLSSSDHLIIPPSLSHRHDDLSNYPTGTFGAQTAPDLSIDSDPSESWTMSGRNSNVGQALPTHNAAVFAMNDLFHFDLLYGNDSAATLPDNHTTFHGTFASDSSFTGMPAPVVPFVGTDESLGSAYSATQTTSDILGDGNVDSAFSDQSAMGSDLRSDDVMKMWTNLPAGLEYVPFSYIFCLC